MLNKILAILKVFTPTPTKTPLSDFMVYGVFFFVGQDLYLNWYDNRSSLYWHSNHIIFY